MRKGPLSILFVCSFHVFMNSQLTVRFQFSDFCAWIIFDIYAWSLIFIMNPIDSIFSNAAIAVLVHTFLVHGWLSVDCSVYFIVTCRLLYPMYSPYPPPP